MQTPNPAYKSPAQRDGRSTVTGSLVQAVLLFALAFMTVFSYAVTPPPVAKRLPESFTARYQVWSGGLNVGVSEWAFHHYPNGRYRFETNNTTTGLARLIRNEHITERSSGDMAVSGPVPTDYLYERVGGKRPRRVQMHFNHSTRTATIDDRAGARSTAITAQVQDRVSYFLKLMVDLGGQSENLAYDVSDRGKLKRYRIEKVGQETLDTAFGALETVSVRRVPDAEDDKETIVWAAPALGYLPVRITHREEGGLDFTLVLSRTSLRRPNAAD